MAISLIKFTFVFLLILAISGCSSRSAEEVACNFVTGATENEYNKEGSGSESFFNSVFSGLFNMVFQGAHRGISPDTYDTCVKKDIATCIDSNGDIKKECTLTK